MLMLVYELSSKVRNALFKDTINLIIYFMSINTKFITNFINLNIIDNILKLTPLYKNSHIG